jgi:hypothetical protein
LKQHDIVFFTNIVKVVLKLLKHGNSVLGIEREKVELLPEALSGKMGSGPNKRKLSRREIIYVQSD